MPGFLFLDVYMMFQGVYLFGKLYFYFLCYQYENVSFVDVNTSVCLKTLGLMYKLSFLDTHYLDLEHGDKNWIYSYFFMNDTNYESIVFLGHEKN